MPLDSNLVGVGTLVDYISLFLFTFFFFLKCYVVWDYSGKIPCNSLCVINDNL